MGRLLLIDGDLCAFRTAAACQHSVYTVHFKDGTEISIRGKAAMNKWYADNPNAEIEHTTRTLHVEPVANACSTARATLRSICDRMKTDKYELYLTGNSNFRAARATIQPYKGNRDPMDKPVLLPDVREYLVQHRGAEIVEGEEADDAIGKRLTAPHPKGIVPVACSMDKDLDMLPGAHYNWVKAYAYKIDEREGWRNFFKQMLTGDDTDNIPGLPKVGPITAEKVLLDCSHHDAMWRAVFKAWHTKYGDRYNDTLSLKEALQEISDLLWIRRHNHERWLVPA